MSRARLGQVNSQTRNTIYVNALKKLLSSVDKEKTVIVISEQSLLGLMVAKLGAKNVIHICEDNHYIRDYISSCAIHNKIHDCISLQNSDWLTTADLSSKKISAVIAEPHFTVS